MTSSAKMIKLASAGEESINALQKLRNENYAKSTQKKAMVEEIEKQLDSIRSLRQEKALLSAQLQELLKGGDIVYLEDEAIIEGARKHLTDLKEKLATHRIVGPCGLTVLDVNPNRLVVSFTCMGQIVSQMFVLSITGDKDVLKVESTNIPYFIGVQSMVEQCKNQPWGKLLDNIGHRLNSYVKRKGEVQTAKTQCADLIKMCSHNDPFTSINLQLNIQKDQSPLRCFLEYESVDLIYPSQVDLEQDDGQLSEVEIAEIKAHLLQLPLSDAMQHISEMVKDRLSQSQGTDTPSGD